MKEYKQNVINFNQLHRLTLVGIDSYLKEGFFATLAKSISPSADGSEEGFYHGGTGKKRAEKLAMYLNKVGDNNPVALLFLLLAVFRDPKEKGCSSMLVSCIARQLIKGSPSLRTLSSEVFSPQAISEISEDKNNFTERHGDYSYTYFEKRKGVRALLLQAINQPEFKSSLSSIQAGLQYNNHYSG